MASGTRSTATVRSDAIARTRPAHKGVAAEKMGIVADSVDGFGVRFVGA